MTSPDTPTDRQPPTLRAATTADVALLAEMTTRSRSSAYRDILPDDYLDRVLPNEALAHWGERVPQVLAGAGRLLIAEVDGTPAGFVCMSEPDDDRSVYIDNLHAMPGHKGAGLGTAMLAEAARWARGRGAQGLHLLVLEANVAAIGFYESRGWRLQRRLDDDELDGLPVVSLVYALALAEADAHG